MTTYTHPTKKAEAGFTLVELAIVMIIIGLLIAGVLKGQQLIGNAKVTAQVAQIKSIDAATSTFKDMYAALPGDISNASTRLPNCGAAPCATNGNGDGSVQGPLTFGAAPAGEQLTYFVHLSAADLMTGINPALGAAVWGGQMPQNKINGGIDVGSAAGGAQLSNGTSIVAASVIGGIYLALHNAQGAVAGDALSANQAARIDTKIDDGNPSSGSVFPAGVVGAAGCTNAGAYLEAVQGNNCGLYIRIQG